VGRTKLLAKAFSALAPPRGEVPPLSGTDLSKPVVVGVAEDALVAFGIAAALNGVADPAVELQKNFRKLSAKTSRQAHRAQMVRR
jgi:hypothetical protein